MQYSLIRKFQVILCRPNYFSRYVTTVRVAENQPYQVKEYGWCFNVPPRCSKYKIKFRTVYKNQTLEKYRPVDDCCEGYKKDEKEEQCVPVCEDECVHGVCVAPNTCACNHGYGGPACDICEYTAYCPFQRDEIRFLST